MKPVIIDRFRSQDLRRSKGMEEGESGKRIARDKQARDRERERGATCTRRERKGDGDVHKEREKPGERCSQRDGERERCRPWRKGLRQREKEK